LDRFSQQVLPVIISVVIIIVVAVVRNYSRPMAAILSTMPLTIPLSLWVVYSGVGGDKEAMTEFTRALVLALLPTVGFAVTAWLAMRAGWRLAPTILAGYATWAVGLALVWFVRRVFRV
jgi:hypothetical protein